MSDLDAILEKWQPRLGLSHWQIAIWYARERDFVNGVSLAEVSHVATCLSANIKILDPMDFDPARTRTEQDVEASVVHELVHLVFVEVEEWISPEDKVRSQFDLERAVKRLERALIAADREE